MKASGRIALIALAIGVFLLPGCNRHSSKEVYYLISSNTALPYWQTVAAGFNQAAAQFKVTAKVTGPAVYDPQAELEALRKAVSAKPAGILISVADANVLLPGINAAIEAGIPVVTVDSDAAASKRLYFIGTNNLEAGRIAGYRVAEKIGGKGNVVIFTLPGQPNTEERLKGFKDAIGAKPEIKIVSVEDVKGDAHAAFDRTQAFLLKTGAEKVTAFVSLESASGKMVADAIKRADLKDREVLTFDSNQGTLESVHDGVIDATIAQKPFTMGFNGLKALDGIFHDPPKRLNKEFSLDPMSPFPFSVDTGIAVIDLSNVNTYLAEIAEQSK